MAELSTLLPTLLASAFGGGIVAGAFSIYNRIASNSEEHEKWLRDQRIESYGNFLNASHALVVACSVYRAGQMTLEDAVGKFTAAQLGPLELLANPDVRAAAEELDRVSDGIFHAIAFGDGIPDRTNFHAAMNEYKEAKSAFLSLVQRELNIPHETDSVAGKELPT